MLSVIVILPILLWAGYTDFKSRIISNKVSIVLLIIGITEIIFFPPYIPISIKERLLVSLLFLLVFVLLYIFRPNISGGGDLKLFSSVGFCIGINLFPVLFFACIIGIIYALIKWRKGESFLKIQLPMASCVAAGSIIFIILSYVLK